MKEIAISLGAILTSAVIRTGYESRFKDSEEKPASDQPPEALRDSLTHRDDACCSACQSGYYRSKNPELSTPSNHNKAQPRRRSDSPQDEITRHFAEDIRDEEDEERNIVVIPGHVEILLQALNPRIANIDAIAKGEQI
jgi:hypothetical protein